MNSSYFQLQNDNNLSSIYYLNQELLTAENSADTLIQYWYQYSTQFVKFKFDVIGISDRGFLSNAHLPEYNVHTQPTKSSAGGVTLYVNSTLIKL